MNSSLAWMLLFLLQQPMECTTLRQHPGGGCRDEEFVIGEKYIPPLLATVFANAYVREAERGLSCDDGWTFVSDTNGTRVETKPVQGPFGASGIVHTRGAATLSAPADTIFATLITPEGFQLIDPASDPADFGVAIETYQWWFCKDCSLRAETAVAAIGAPPEGLREFVVLNAIDPNRRIFVSKSILHPLFPGGSIYSDNYAGTPDIARAVNTFAVRVTPKGDDESLVEVINWIDFTGLPLEVSNGIALGFLDPLFERFRGAFEA